VSRDAPDITGISGVTIDCSDPGALSLWWSRLLGGGVDIDEDGDIRLLLPRLAIIFNQVPERKMIKNRLHIDLSSRDFYAAVEQAIALGAVPAADIYDSDRWQVLRDPEGNEFCILRS
jgi:hypothetical protein